MTSNDGWQIIYSHDGYKRPVFDWEDSHILNFSTAGSGSGTLSSPTTMTIVNAGNTIDYTATPGGSSSFSERQQNDGSTYSTEKTITLSDIKADSPLTAVFEPRSGTYTAVFTITNGAGAIVTLDGQDYKLDSNGELSISNLENGTYSYKITRSGSTSLSGTVTISEADVAVTGTIESVIFIYTFDVQRISTGIVVENATVTCTYNSSATSKTTDVNGQVDFYNYYGSFQYKVEANGYKTVSGTFYNYGTNKKHNKTINLYLLQDVNFTVTDGGNPIVGAEVLFNGSAYTSDVNGEISIRDVPEGTYSYTATASGYHDRSGSVTFTDNPANETITMIQNVSSDLTFKITDENGNALRNAEVTFEGITYTTDPNGKLTVTGGYGDTYSYTVSAYGYDDYAGSVTLSDAEVSETVNMTELTYTLSFTVTDGTLPISGAIIQIDGTAYTTNSNGEVSISDLLNGTYAYTVCTTGYADNSGLAVISYSGLSKIIVMSTNPYDVIFTVTDGTNAIANASIVFNGTTYSANANGVFVLRNVPTGT